MRLINKYSLGFSIAVFSVSSVFASGFQAFEQNASLLGDSYAGSAAYAKDASVEFDNPAGLVRLAHPSFAASEILLRAHSNFEVTKATNALGEDVTSTSNKNKINPLGNNYIPAFHLATPIYQDKLFFGFGITVPFGLETSYPKDSGARYMGTHSQVITMNLAPSLAFKFNDKFSIGAGIDAQRLAADLDQQFDTTSILGSSYSKSSLKTDAAINNSADGWGYGWHAGMLYQFTPKTRLGINYRSVIHHEVSGRVKVQYPTVLTDEDIDQLKANGIKDGRVSSSMTLPQMISMGLYHELTKELAVLSSITYTDWSSFKELTLHFADNNQDQGVLTTPENFHNSWRFALGFNLKLSSKWLLKVGSAYDQSPVSERNRTIRIPDADRIWVSTGVGYQFNDRWSVDAGYAHVFIENGPVNDHGVAKTSVAGYYNNNYADIFGLQLNMNLN